MLGGFVGRIFGFARRVALSFSEEERNFLCDNEHEATEHLLFFNKRVATLLRKKDELAEWNHWFWSVNDKTMHDTRCPISSIELTLSVLFLITLFSFSFI